jgi:ABC-2 type transport system permease protein
VMWKEWKELLISQGSLRGGLLLLIVLIGVFGIVFPLQEGPGWVESQLVLINAAWLPFFLASSTVPDSFAGDRERKTLETLLASRLSDRAILFGKIGAAISYGWGLTLISESLALIAVNVAYGHDQLLLYSPMTGLEILVLSLLGAGLAAGSGILVSLRAATVRQAYQQLSLANILLPILLFFGFQALPGEWRVQLTQTLIAASTTQIVVGIVVILVIVDAGLIAVAMARFQRARLILD